GRSTAAHRSRHRHLLGSCEPRFPRARPSGRRWRRASPRPRAAATPWSSRTRRPASNAASPTASCTWCAPPRRPTRPWAARPGPPYTDGGVKADEQCRYELRGMQPNGEDRLLAIDVAVWAGHFVLPDPPSGVTTQAGDRRVLVLWNRNPYAATYVVQRATSPG